MKYSFKGLNWVLFILIFSLFLSEHLIAQTNKRGVVQKWNTDTTKSFVPLKELNVLLERDIIKPIDNPEFVKKDSASSIFYKNEPVISIVINNKAKAYPLGLLMSHEIVNDKIDSLEFTVTYCPLCNTSNVYNRNITFKGKKYLLDFGTSGMLRKSNLVMWDRQTESWWQQITKKAIVGKLAGAELKQLPSQLLSIKDFFESYPDGEILCYCMDNMKYGRNPYYKYDDLETKTPRLFFGNVHPALPAMTRILSINNIKKIYPFPVLKKRGVVPDNIGEKDLVIFFKEGQVSVVDEKLIKDSRNVGTATLFIPEIEGKKLRFKRNNNYFIDKNSNSKWLITGKCVSGKFKGKKLTALPYSVNFAFVWFAFFPESVLYK